MELSFYNIALQFHCVPELQSIQFYTQRIQRHGQLGNRRSPRSQFDLLGCIGLEHEHTTGT